MKKAKESCIHCHNCQESCEFLKKYQIDIGDAARLEELAFHCFLCGKCSLVCPVGIDGRQLILDMRRNTSAQNSKSLRKREYQILMYEKLDYRFRNYRHCEGTSVLFPGCNFPSLFPKTARKLSLLFEEVGIGTVYDCCGKPIGELGLLQKEEQIAERMEEALRKRGVEEIITLCPNCYYFLKEHLSLKVTGIYEILREPPFSHWIRKDALKKKTEAAGRVYVPCPDYETKEWYGQLAALLPDGHQLLEDIQCCGLGGLAGFCDKSLADSVGEKMRQYEKDRVWTYCASCCGSYVRKGISCVEHVLPALLGTGEEPAVKTSMFHRMLTKYC